MIVDWFAARALSWLGPLMALGCAASDGGPTDREPTPDELFGDDIASIRIEVDYQEGAEPYTDAQGNRPDPWTLFGQNLERLFSLSDKDLVYPTTLGEMEAIGAAEAETYDIDDILELADAHRDHLSDGDRATFYFVWIDGAYADADGVQDTVLGVSIRETGVVAMFKPALASTGAASPVARIGEQTTLIHEFGHAIGLVDNGIPLTSDHLDEEHGAHCTNTSCAMYFGLESVSDLLDFARTLNQTGEAIVFGSECLADVDALAGR